MLLYLTILITLTLSEADIDIKSKIASLDEVKQQEVMNIISSGDYSDHNLVKYPFLKNLKETKRKSGFENLSNLFGFKHQSKFKFDVFKEKFSDVVTMCEYSFKTCLLEVINVLIEQIQYFMQDYMFIQLIIFIIFEVLYYYLHEKFEINIFRLFVRKVEKETSEFKVYKASKVRTTVYFVSKISLLTCKLTIIYCIVETMFIFILGILSAIAYAIYYMFYWSFYDFMIRRQRKFKSKKNVRITYPQKTLAFKEIGVTYNSDLVTIYLQKLFNSDCNSNVLVKDVCLNVLGSLTDFAVRYENLLFDANNQFGNVNRSKSYAQWTNEQKQEIVNQLDNLRNVIMNFKSFSNTQFIQAVCKIIVYLVNQVQLNANRNRDDIVELESNDKFIKKIRESADRYVDAFRYDYYANQLLLRRIYYCANLIYDVTFLGEGLTQIQVYGDRLSTTAVLASKIKGKVLIKSKEAEKLILKLKQLNSDLVYESSDMEIEHAFSHYISKVMHMTVINEHIEVGTYHKILDVGSSLSDIQLGNGVSYCIADVEEQDGRRILNVFERVKMYLAKNQNHSITIYNGDVTKFNFKNTEVNRFVLHNSCYNIDLVDLLHTASLSNCEYVVNSVQVPINILHGMDAESIDNEMKWSIVEGEMTSSNLTESKYYIKSSTRIDLYPHSLAVFIDWFKRCSLVIRYNNKTINWNSNVIRAVLGYYNFVWCPSKCVKKEGVLKNNDDYTDTISVKEEPGYYTIVNIPRHIRFTTVDSMLNQPKEFKNKSSIEDVATKLLETRISKETKVINVVQDTNFEVLSRLQKHDAIITKSSRDNYYQIKAEVTILQNCDSSNDKYVNAACVNKFNINDAISSINNDDIQSFVDKISEADNEIYIKFDDDEQFYYVDKSDKVEVNMDRYYIAIKSNKATYTVSKSRLNDLNYVKLNNMVALYNLIVNKISRDENTNANLLNTEKLEQYLDKAKGSQIAIMTQQIQQRKLCLTQELKQYYEQHDRLVNRGVTTDLNSKVYICDIDNDSSVDEVYKARLTGRLSLDHINCLVYVNCKDNSYYTSQPILNFAEGRLNVTTNVVNCEYNKYIASFDETDHRIEVVHNESVKPLIKIVLNNGEVIYSINLESITKLRFSQQPAILSAEQVSNYIF